MDRPGFPVKIEQGTRGYFSYWVLTELRASQVAKYCGLKAANPHTTHKPKPGRNAGLLFVDFGVGKCEMSIVGNCLFWLFSSIILQEKFSIRQKPLT